MIEKFYYGLLNRVYGYDDYTQQEINSKLIQKMDEVIDNCNNAFEFLDWLKEQGISEELQTILDTMLEDGTLEKLINIEKLNRLNDSIVKNKEGIDNIKNLDDFFKDDVLLIPSYWGFLRGPENLELYLSNDCRNCYAINTQPIYRNKTGREFYDYCGMYYNNKFYFLCDYRSTDEYWGGDSFAIISTSDFINYDEHHMKIGANTPNCEQSWAPEFFVHENEVYMFYALHFTGDTYQRPAISTGTKDKFSIYYSKALDNTLRNWSEPEKINFDNDESKIDPCVVYKNGLFHMFVCRDTDIVIDHYTSRTIDGVWERAGIIDMPCKTEAPAVIEFKNKYYMFLDSYRSTGDNDQGLYHVLESTDLYNWSTPKVLKNQCNSIMRHFSPIVLKTDEQKQIIKDLYNRVNNNQGNSLINTMKQIQLSSNKRGISYTDLGSLTNTGIIEELKVQKNTIYYLGGVKRTVTIKKINIDLLDNYDEFHFMITAGNSDTKTKIVIMNSCTGWGNTFLPLRLDYITLGGLEVNNSFKYTFFVKDKFIRCSLLPQYIFETKPYIPYNFVKNGSFVNEFTDWKNMNEVTQEVVADGLKYGKSCHLTSTTGAQYKGISQDIELNANTKYDFSCYYLVKNKSSFNNNFALEIKARRSNEPLDYLLAKKQINIDEVNEYTWSKITAYIDTTEIDLDLYESFYIYFYMIDEGDIYVTDFSLTKSNSN